MQPAAAPHASCPPGSRDFMTAGATIPSASREQREAVHGRRMAGGLREASRRPRRNPRFAPDFLERKLSPSYAMPTLPLASYVTPTPTLASYVTPTTAIVIRMDDPEPLPPNVPGSPQPIPPEVPPIPVLPG